MTLKKIYCFTIEYFKVIEITLLNVINTKASIVVWLNKNTINRS